MDKQLEQRYVEALKKSSDKIKELLAELDSLKKGEPIAIIGMGCRFAGGVHTPQEFWELLEQGKDTIREVPPDRWPIDQYYDPDVNASGKMYSRYGGFLEDVDQFDCSFFGISPREAEVLDPQQRLLLEVSWEALENAGQSVEALKESTTGVYVGILSNEYGATRFVSGNVEEINAYSLTGVAHSIAAGRISYLFGFQGPNIAIDTSCASSLVALYLGAASLQRKESDLVLAGGANFIISPECQIAFSKLNALSPDGRCKTFDAASDGIGRGEGCGMVVLKRLSEAIRDRDNILAVIRGSAINQDGTSNGLTAPNGIAQQKVIRQALQNAQVSPEEVSYIEAHGTGTPLGDPIEIRSLAKIFQNQELCIGSVKTNLGHLESAAGIAGLLKVILSMQHEKIPPHLHFSKPNPHIAWEESSFTIPSNGQPWPKTTKPRIAGISSFGLSGTNAHVLIAEAPEASEFINPIERPLHILNLSAKKKESLHELVSRYHTYFDQIEETSKEETEDICYTANVGRSHFPQRLSVVGESIEDIKQKLFSYLKGQVDRGCFHSDDSSKINAQLVFLFTGQGSQYRGMGRGLYETQPFFKDILDQCDGLFAPYLNESIISLLYVEETAEDLINQTLYTQAAIFSIEYALAKLWESWGVRPSVVMGHSIGEYVAACIAGVFSLEDAVKLVANRGKLMQSLPGGVMAAVVVEEPAARQVLEEFGEKVSIAAINAAKSVVISGETENVHAVLKKFEKTGTRYQILKVSHAFHSPMMEPILQDFQTVAAQINYFRPRLPIISNATGIPIQISNKNSAKDWAQYWTDHIRGTVRFYDSIKYLEEEGYELFLEIGAAPILSGLGKQCFTQNKGIWLPSLRQGQADWQQILETLAQLYVHGLKIDWVGFDQPYSRKKVILPTYPFLRKRYWKEFFHSQPGLGKKTENLELTERKVSNQVKTTPEKTVPTTEATLGIPQSGNSPLERMMIQQHQTMTQQLEVMERQLQALQGKPVAVKTTKSHQTTVPSPQMPSLAEEKTVEPETQQIFSHPMSSGQKRLFIISQHARGTESYHLFGAWWFSGDLDIQKLEQSIQVMIKRHESLRSSFLIEGEEWVCRVHPEVPFELIVEEGREGSVEELLSSFIQQFDLFQPPLLKVGLFRFPDKRYLFIVNAHHIILDGLSLSVFAKESMMLYQGLPLPALKAQYKDYVAWQNRFFQSPAFTEQEAYWLKHLSGELPVLDLPMDYPRGAESNFRRADFSIQHPSAELHALAKSQGVSLYMVLVAAYYIWLFRLTGQDDVVIGTVSSHRPFAEFNQIVGMITNTLAMRAYPTGDKDFFSFLQEVKTVCLETYANPDYPFERLVEKLELAQTPNRHPVFETMFSYEKADERILKMQGLEITPCFEKQSYMFDLALDVIEQAGVLHLTFEYDSSLFKPETIERFVGYLIRILEEISQQPEQKLSEIEILPVQEKQLLLETFNQTQMDYPQEKSWVDLFEEQVEKNPEVIAISCGGECLTYRQLNERSNQVAHHLRQQYQITADVRVAILMERTEWMMVALLGILKAGGAYVPIDPNFPAQRIEYILQDSQTKVVLTEDEVRTRVALPPYVEVVELASITTKETTNLDVTVKPSDLAYLIYTSGSTGNPKGVMIEHRNVISFAANLPDTFAIRPTDTIYGLTTLTFDISVLELLCSLIHGIRILLASNQERNDPKAIGQVLQQKEITVLQVTPSRLKWLLESQHIDTLQSLRVLLVGGEALPKSLAKQLQVLRNTKVFNVYGPTETTIWSTANLLKEGEVTIGTPLLNEEVYILSKDGQLQPLGVIGELCIGGAGVGRGYANRSELTAEKFVKNPFREGENLYRTGDLARWMPDGNLEFLGRGDDQVKIRGHRVELGEIEHYLQKHPAIEEAVVVAREAGDGEKELAAYLRGDDGLEITKLRQFLSESLPENLIPSYFTWLDQFPLNPSGKINRGALPEPEGRALGSAYEAPRNQVEAKLVGLWEEILGQSPIGIHDNFFDRGGHSLKTVQLLSRIQKHLEVELSLKDIFAFSTIAKLASVITGQEVKAFAPIESVEEAEDYELSHAQQRLWVLHQMEELSAVYNVTGALRLEGNLNREALFHSLQALVARHESLRTCFVHVAGEPRQKIGEVPELAVEELDLSQEENPVLAAQEIVQSEGRHVFDLEKGPLFRIKLLKLSPVSHVLVVNLHHVICDGWSLGVLTQELGVLYHAFHQGESNPLPPLTIQYKDYSAWQKNWLAGEDARQAREYWHEQLSGELPVLELPTDRPRPLVQTFAGKTFRKEFSPEWTGRINEWVKGEESTLFMGLVALVKVLLYRYSGQQEILVGTPIAGRRHVDLENQIGCYINMLPLRDSLEGNHSFATFLTRVRQTTLAAYEYQEYPFDQLVDELNLERNLSRSPLFDVIVALQNAEQLPPQLEEIKIEDFSFSQEVSRLDLTFNFTEREERLVCEIEYNTSLFDEGRIKRMGNHLEILFDSIFSNPVQPVDALNLLTESEREQLLVEFNATASDYPRDKSVIELFEEQVLQTPDATALVFEGILLSYRELNERANQIGFYLRKQFHLKPEDVVGVLAEPSERMIIAVLGIVKAGAAYLPIDPLYPDERIAYILQDAQPKAVFSDVASEGRFSATNVPLCSLDGNAEIEAAPTVNLPVVTTPASLAYIMYTSGTTGIPKGSLIEHRSIVRLVKNTNYIEIEPTDRILQTGSLAFDASTLEIWGAFLNGAQLHLARKDTLLHASEFSRVLSENKITIIWLTGGLFNQLIEIDHEMFAELDHLLVGGEKLSLAHINKARKAHVNLEIINGYGPTENTTFSACYRIEHEFDRDIPIGTPIANSTAYILGNNDQLQPIGVPGELCLGGDGVSRGYLNNDSLTQEKFVPNPFFPEERLYRSGDICRWTEGGLIEYLGRQDDQVKVRGFRVEPAEIELHLQEYSSIQDAVVIVREVEGGRELIAYLVGNQKLDTAQLWQYLSGKLPKYMIPSYFIQLDQFPLNRNGKVDKKALPDPEGGTLVSSPYQAPRSSLEVHLVSLWEEILAQNPIGIHDNFFERGGHSLKAVQLISRIHQQLELEVSLREIFAFSTIGQLAEVIQSKDSEAFQAIESVAPTEHYPLSHAQRRLWVLYQLEENPVAYNVTTALLLEGTLNQEALHKALQSLASQHESLRTTFFSIQGEPRQKIHSTLDFRLEEIDLSQEKNARLRAQMLVRKEVHQSFDLEKGPLVRVKLIKLSSVSCVLVINLHHIICDGWSVGVMIRELGTLYRAFHRGENNPLQPLSIQYKDYAAWQQEWLAGHQAEVDQTYWHQKLSGSLPILELPTDRPRPSVQTFQGNRIWKKLGKEPTQALQKFIQQQNVTLFMGLVAVIRVLLYRYSGQDDIIVGTPVAGRNHVDLENQIGCYINMLAMRDTIEGSQSFENFLAQVKQTTLEAYEHQEYPFDQLVDELNLGRNLAHSPLFDIMVALHNQEQPALALDELSIQEFPCAVEVSKFDLTFNFVEQEEELVCEIEYNTSLFNEDRIYRLGEHFVALAQSLVADSTQSLDAVNLLTEKEKEQQLIQFNATGADYPKEKTIVDLLEEQAQKRPEAVALIYGKRKLTYLELNEQANQVAHYLRDHYKIQSDERVGIFLDRTEWLVIAILGILKAGGAYVPIDPEYPIPRIEYMLQDSQAQVVLTEAKHEQKIAAMDPVIIDITEIPPGKTENLKSVVLPSHLAYVIYTSGSTGTPKGVMIEHRNVISFAANLPACFAISPTDRMYALTTITFDISVLELLCCLVQGIEIVLASNHELVSPPAIAEAFAQHHITVLQVTPSRLKWLLDSQAMELLQQLKVLLVGGEPLPPSLAGKLRQLPNTRSFNVYGPTETTIWSSYKELIEEEITIGSPLLNEEIYIVSDNNQLQPLGIPGELCIGGDGVGRGYMNRPELTAEKFVKNPFKPGERSYRTGDLACWLPNGIIQFLGRKDDQVKIRGFRIELGEIENALQLHAQVREVVVIAREIEEGSRELVAYLIGATELSITELREYLSQTLPVYMIPSYFVQVEQFPLNSSGKINKRALPDPEATTLSLESPYTPPRNEIETQLVEIWEAALGRKEIGIHDNYFALGGDSIKAIQIISRLSQSQLTLGLRTIFEYPTIAELAMQLDEQDSNTDQDVIVGQLPLTPRQCQIFQNPYGHHHFNQAVMLCFQDRIQEDALRTVLTAIQEHHDALRMCYQINSDSITQENVDLTYPLGLEILDWTENSGVQESMKKYIEQVQASIDLEQGPLMKVVLFRTKDVDYLLIVIHHLVMDHISWQILMEDFIQGYQQCCSEETVVFPAKTTSFKKWAEVVHQYSNTNQVLQETAYWSQLASVQVPLLPQDKTPPDNLEKDTWFIRIRLSEEKTHLLLKQVHQAYNTEIHELLLTALARTLWRWTGEKRSLITLEGDGRKAEMEGLDARRTIGWFQSEYPFLLDISESDDLGYQIKNIKEMFRRVPNQGIGYGMLRYITNPDKSQKHALDVTPQIFFNYLGEFDDVLNNDLFSLADEPVGITINPDFSRCYHLEIKGLVIGGQLELIFSYHRKMYHKSTIETLTDFYKKELLGVITHCLNQEPELTPSDVTGYDGLDIDTLDQILDDLSS